MVFCFVVPSPTDPAIEEICRRLADKFPLASPFHAIAGKLASGIKDRNQTDASTYAAMIGLANFCLNRLPAMPATRFWLDSEMIQEVARAVADAGGPRLTNIIFPVYDQQWGHISCPISSNDPLQGYRVNLILFQGHDRTEEMDLLQYPWLYHEFAHILIADFGQSYQQNVAAAYAKEMISRKVRAMNDSAVSKAKLKDTLVKLAEYWQPENRLQGWTVEVATDLVALWLCGPAYCSAMMEVFQSARDPHLLTVEHPSYEMRAWALLRSINRIGWHENTHELEMLLTRWRGENQVSGSNNSYLNFASRELLGECVACALDFCEDLKLPLCQPAVIGRMASESIRDGIIPELGGQLVGIAYHLKKRLSEKDYLSWQASVREAHAAAYHDEEIRP